MKLIYTVIDGMGDLPVEALDNQTPLEAAHTPALDFLAKAGKTGLMYPVKRGIAPESDVAVISILGYDPFKYGTGRGPLEASGAGLPFKDGDLAVRCNFATQGHGQTIVDRRAGRDLTHREATRLAQAVNEETQLNAYPATFTFKNTIGHRAVMVFQSQKAPLSGNVTNTDPAYTREQGLGVAKAGTKMILQECHPLDNTAAAKTSATLVNEFVRRSHEVLARHDVNQRRAAEGKLEANVILTRDAGHLLPRLFNINERYGLRFAALTDMPVEIGIAKTAGMHMIPLPPPSTDYEGDFTLRAELLLHSLPHHDCFYIHLKGPDEPGHDGNFQLKKHILTLVDQHFFGNLLHAIDLQRHIVCVTADHSTPCRLKAHSDDPVPLLIASGTSAGDQVARFSEAACREGSLGVLDRGVELMPKLVQLMKA
jgi:2,3-bisphosphoglycerate-independent phosphoglycerate mutase